MAPRTTPTSTIQATSPPTRRTTDRLLRPLDPESQSADRSVRRVENLGGDDDLAKNAAANKAIATGDPRYMRQIELDGAVADLQADADAHFAATRSREGELGALTTAIPGHQQAIAALSAAVPAVEAHLAANSSRCTPNSTTSNANSERKKTAPKRSPVEPRCKSVSNTKGENPVGRSCSTRHRHSSNNSNASTPTRSE